MRRDQARFGVLLHVVYIVIIAFYCVQIFSTPSTSSTVSAKNNSQVLSATDTSSDNYASELLDNNELEIFNHINNVRLQSDLSSLNVSAHLTEVARMRAQDMVNRGYYSHRSPDGKYYYDSLNSRYSGLYSCENLEMEFSLDTKMFVDNWLASEKHKSCLLAPTTKEVGYAISELDLGTNSNVQKAYIVVAIYSEAPIH